MNWTLLKFKTANDTKIKFIKLTQNVYSEYIKNNYNSIIRKQFNTNGQKY